MNLSDFDWLIIVVVGGALFGVVIYFLKRTMSVSDTHGTRIHTLEQNSATKAETQQHEDDINQIKQTYVTRDEMKEMRTELKDEIEKLSRTVGEIHKHSLPKEDFYRSHMETNRKLESLQQLIVDRLGGG